MDFSPSKRYKNATCPNYDNVKKHKVKSDKKKPKDPDSEYLHVNWTKLFQQSSRAAPGMFSGGCSSDMTMVYNPVMSHMARLRGDLATLLSCQSQHSVTTLLSQLDQNSDSDNDKKT